MKKLHTYLINNHQWYAKWHNRRHHEKVHWGLLAAAILLIGISISSSEEIAAKNFVMTAQEKVQFAEMNGLRLLEEGEYAVITDPSRKVSSQSTFKTFDLQIGEVVEQKIGDNIIVNVIEYESGKDTFISAKDSNITVKNIYSYSGFESNGKVEKAIGKKLKKDGKASVIVEMNLPSKKFYDLKDTPSARASKINEFLQGKSSVAGTIVNDGSIKSDLKIINAVSVEIKNEKALEALGKNPKVKRVTLDRPKKLILDQSVPQIHAPEVYGFVDQSGRALTGNGIRVAVIDSGIDYNHADLGGCFGPTCKVIGGYDFVYNDADPMDDNGHGTHVAATVAGLGLMSGVAPDAKLLSYKVCNSGGACDTSDLIAAFNASVDPNGDGNPIDHVDIATTSIGGDCGPILSDSCGPTDPVSLAVDNASALGVVNTIAAGNSGPSPSTINSPGVARSAITVAAACKTAAVGGTGTCAQPIASFSSRGPSTFNGEDLQKPDIAAPGVNICAAKIGSIGGNCGDGRHYFLSGTSMATPHMAGVAALIKQANPTYTTEQIKQRIKDTATDLGATYNEQGAGLVNVAVAIPLVSEISSNPKLLRVTTTPTTATHTTTQSFTVTALNNTVGTVSVEFSSSVPGITFSSSKPTLNLSNLASDTFTATFYVDNNTVIPGSHPANIFFVQNGARRGVIPVQFTVVPTITAVPQVVDYGNFDPALSSWQSGNFPITFTNKRTDTAQTVTLSSSPFASGITYQFSPTTLTIPAGGTAIVNTSITANNNTANTIHNGVLTATNGANEIRVPLKFSRLHVLELSDSTSASAFGGAAIALGARNSNIRVWTTISNNPFRLYFSSTPLVDFVVRYASSSTGVGYLVAREAVTVSGTTRVSISKSEADNLVRLVATDKNNQPRQAGYKFFLLVDPQTKIPRIFVSFVFPGDFYISDISNVTNLELVTVPINASALDVYMYGGLRTGITSDWTITNAANDLKKVTFYNHNNKPGQQYGPVMYSCFAPNTYDCMAVGSSIESYTFIDPGFQVLYSTRPRDYFVFQDSNNLGCGGISGPCQSQFFSPAVDTATGKRKVVPYHEEFVSWPETNRVYNGLAPQILFAKVKNASNMYLATLYPGYNALRQDFAEPPATYMEVTLKKDGTIISQQPVGIGMSGSSEIPERFLNLFPMSLGQFELTVPYTYKARNQLMNGFYKQTFDTTKSDSNPPFASAIFFYNDTYRSETYDPAKSNKVVAHLDPNTGTMQNVTMSYSPDGTNFTPFASSASNGIYTGNIPQLPSATKGIFRISATDSSLNTYEFTFELPQGSSLNVDDTSSPSVTITAPANGATVSTTFPITANATDDAGVTKVEFYIQGPTIGPVPSLIATDTIAPYATEWNPWLGWVSNYNYEITAKAYDAAGNIGTSAGVTILAATVPPSDLVAPTVSITNPANNATVSGTTVVISATATDNVGVDHVDFMLSGGELPAPVVIGADATAPYSISWNSTTVSNGGYIITARAYDALGNSATNQRSIQVSNSGTPPPSDTTKPTVTITAPVNGASVIGNITLSASATDNVGVTKVEFYNGRTLIDTDTTGSPGFAVIWKVPKAKNKTYSLTAKAYDAAGNIGQSTVIQVRSQ